MIILLKIYLTIIYLTITVVEHLIPGEATTTGAGWVAATTAPIATAAIATGAGATTTGAGATTTGRGATTTGLGLTTTAEDRCTVVVRLVR
nr:hypothetical protein [Olivibacter jilunii]